MTECFSHHLDGIDNIPATKKLKFVDPTNQGLGFSIDLCDSCYDNRKSAILKSKTMEIEEL